MNRISAIRLNRPAECSARKPICGPNMLLSTVVFQKLVPGSAVGISPVYRCRPCRLRCSWRSRRTYPAIAATASRQNGSQMPPLWKIGNRQLRFSSTPFMRGHVPHRNRVEQRHQRHFVAEVGESGIVSGRRGNRQSIDRQVRSVAGHRGRPNTNGTLVNGSGTKNGLAFKSESKPPTVVSTKPNSKCCGSLNTTVKPAGVLAFPAK